VDKQCLINNIEGDADFRRRELFEAHFSIPRRWPTPGGITMKMLYKESLMKVRYLLLVASTIVMFLACAGSREQVKKKPEITPNEISAVPELKEPLDAVALAKIRELKQNLVMNGVPGKWFDEQLQNETFQIHPTIDRYFQQSAEKQVDQDKKRDASWYFVRVGVDAKIEKGKRFIEAHSDIFKKAEARHGIHQELVAAIVGMETDFADHHERGKFYAFNSLVSQYIFTNRKKFSVGEITALYKFSRMTGRSPQYFTSSYAGAIGWGQFLPSSLVEFFIDVNGIPEDADPFSLDDTIFSVENYLHEHNLSGKNIDDYDARYKAVFAYNHSDIYVKAVLFIYDRLRDYFKRPNEY